MPLDEFLPGYAWDDKTARYIQTSPKPRRFVARKKILELLDTEVHQRERALSDLSELCASGKISPAIWLDQMGQILRRLHLQNAALGAGGWDRMTQSDYGRVGGILKADQRRLMGFLQDLVDGKLSTAQARNRAELYAGNARRQFWLAERQRVPTKEGIAVIERRELGPAEHCNDCDHYSQMGWQTFGTLPVPGEGSECLSHCRCNLVRKEVPIEKVADYVGGGA